MAPESVSFRITRTTEDLAQTVSALSHRLVKLEQRLATMELELSSRDQPDPGELDTLTNVEGLLRDCRQLLEESVPEAGSGPAVVGSAFDGDDHGPGLYVEAA